MFWVEKSSEFGVEFESCMRFSEGGKVLDRLQQDKLQCFYKVKKGERKGQEGRKGIKRDENGDDRTFLLGRCHKPFTSLPNRG